MIGGREIARGLCDQERGCRRRTTRFDSRQGSPTAARPFFAVHRAGHLERNPAPRPRGRLADRGGERSCDGSSTTDRPRGRTVSWSPDSPGQVSILDAPLGSVTLTNHATRSRPSSSLAPRAPDLLAHPEPSLRFIGVVRTAAQLEVLSGGCAALRIGNDVVVLRNPRSVHRPAAPTNAH